MKHIRYIRDIKKKSLFFKSELFQLVIKILIRKNSNTLKSEIKILFLSLIAKDVFKCRSKNLCTITSRSRFVFKKFKVSRIFLRNLGGSGYILGLKQSSW